MKIAGFILTVYIEICVAVGMFVVLKRGGSVGISIISWVFSPVLYTGGVFIKKDRRKLYYQKVRILLFNK